MYLLLITTRRGASDAGEMILAQVSALRLRQARRACQLRKRVLLIRQTSKCSRYFNTLAILYFSRLFHPLQNFSSQRFDTSTCLRLRTHVKASMMSMSMTVKLADSSTAWTCQLLLLCRLTSSETQLVPIPSASSALGSSSIRY